MKISTKVKEEIRKLVKIDGSHIVVVKFRIKSMFDVDFNDYVKFTKNEFSKKYGIKSI